MYIIVPIEVYLLSLKKVLLDKRGEALQSKEKYISYTHHHMLTSYVQSLTECYAD